MRAKDFAYRLIRRLNAGMTFDLPSNFFSFGWYLFFKRIPTQETRLTGAQIRFVREFLGMSLRCFASKVVHQSHMAVSKWEKFGNEPTNMDAATEVVLRLYVFHEISKKNLNGKKSFFKLMRL